MNMVKETDPTMPVVNQIELCHVCGHMFSCLPAVVRPAVVSCSVPTGGTESKKVILNIFFRGRLITQIL